MKTFEQVSTVEELHRAVDLEATRLGRLHTARLHCKRGCIACCVDELTVFTVEAALIRTRHGDILARQAPHAPGACAFLDNAGTCRIYPDRPYVCRTQGLPLRWIEDDDADPVELRDICPLNETPEAQPIETLAATACWTLGPAEDALRTLQLNATGALERVPLRSLFKNDAMERSNLPECRDDR